MYENFFAGCDISKATIDVCLLSEDGRRREKCFINSAQGHEQLLNWVLRPKATVRVVIEATGNYSIDLALVLDAAEGIELMVANPRATRKFADAQMRRSKTDRVDAQVLSDFACRMQFVPWLRPDATILELRGIARRIQALTVERARERARLHQANVTKTTPAVVLNDIEVNIRHLDRRVDEMLRQALMIVASNAQLNAAFRHLTSVRGIADKSAVLILPEILILPSEITLRQWVAYAGLDPRKHESGTSVQKRERISKVGNVHLRRALYMPALVAIRWEPNIGAFYEHLIARGKKPLVAIVAVMRKLLHSIYGMLKHDTDFDGDKFYQIPSTTT